jgi:hypothetical protein
MRRKLSNGSSLEVRLFSPKERRLAKATQRAADSLAAAGSVSGQCQLTNRFVPNASEWTIETVPDPLPGEALD